MAGRTDTCSGRSRLALGHARKQAKVQVSVASSFFQIAPPAGLQKSEAAGPSTLSCCSQGPFRPHVRDALAQASPAPRSVCTLPAASPTRSYASVSEGPSVPPTPPSSPQGPCLLFATRHPGAPGRGSALALKVPCCFCDGIISESSAPPLSEAGQGSGSGFCL